MRNALSAAIVTGTVNKTGAIDLFASRAKTALFPSDIVRKPRNSSTIPAFSSSFDEKISCFIGVFIKSVAPENQKRLWQLLFKLLQSFFFYFVILLRALRFSRDSCSILISSNPLFTPSTPVQFSCSVIPGDSKCRRCA